MALTASDARILRRAMGINGNGHSEILELRSRLRESERMSQYRLETITKMDAEIQKLKRYISEQLSTPEAEDDGERDQY